jgi:hypothetical protein
MLIIALGVLTLLAVLGATFAQLMRLERKASNNYIDAQRMDLVSSSALDRVIAKLHEARNHYSWTFYKNTDWLFLIRGEDDLGHGRVSIDDRRVGRWENYMEVAGYLYRFKTKVIDTNAQINLNGRQDTLARMLDNLGQAIDSSERLKRDGKKISNPFYTAPNRSGKQVRGEDIMLFRQRLEGQRFQSKNQLRQLIGDQNYEIVKDFVTCHSWEDPYTYRADDGENEVRDLAVGSSPGGVGGGVGGGAVTRHPEAVGSPRLSPEPRHPININTAPPEVLIACFMGLAGRRVFPHSRLGSGGGTVQPVDQNAQILGERIFANEEVREVAPRPVFVYTPRLEYSHAIKLVQRVIGDRKNGAKFPRTWRTNDDARPGFEDFIDLLDESYFPSHSNIYPIDPDWPSQHRVLKGQIVGGTSEVARMWQKGTAQGGERNTLRKLALPVHERNAWYFEAIKSVIKANFNPNTRINRYNPNVPAYIPVDKSDLVWADPTGGSIPVLKKGHTTEFCFDAMGTFEITTLGEMLDMTKFSPKVAQTFVDGGSGTTRGGNRAGGGPNAPASYFPFRRKVRTIVKVFDVLRHTNQFHFEKTFNVGARASKNDRKFVQTWPEPMNALTDLYSQGSLRDGRVELAGLLDAQRQQVAFSSRQQLFGRDPAILAEHSFSERDPQNVTRLRRALQGGGISLFGDEVSDALKGVYDFNYVRQQRSYREFYRLKHMQTVGVFRNTAGQYADPIIGREVLGTDLFPDGFHTSMFRMQHLGNRMLVLPARQRIGDAGGGGGSTRVGASGLGTRGQNVIGNVPYYNGGLAFWCKFEFAGDDPVFSGLVGCTQVIKDVSANAQDFTGSEGTQFYIFKNTSGQLRIVRMYYHQAFPEMGAGGGGGGNAAGVQLMPDPGVSEEESQASGDNPILENLDQQKLVSRSDIVVDIRKFKAHEWHHIALEWNDQNQAYPIRIYLDFVPVQQGGQPRRAQQVVDGTANSWVRLNHRQPIDGLMINGFVRPQGVSDAGIFKWFTTTEKTAGGSGVRISTPTVKRIIGNATIDEFVVFEGGFPQIKRHYGTTSAGAGYFTHRPGEYANLFEIPMPTEVDSVTLRAFDWTSYYPTTYTDSLPNSVAQRLVNEPIRCQLWYVTRESLPPQFDEPWRRSQVRNQVAGRRVYRPETGLRGKSAEFVYKFTMRGSRSLTGNTAGGVVQTPVIDDVTLSYYLPSPRILLQEDAD